MRAQLTRTGSLLLALSALCACKVDVGKIPLHEADSGADGPGASRSEAGLEDGRVQGHDAGVGGGPAPDADGAAVDARDADTGPDAGAAIDAAESGMDAAGVGVDAADTTDTGTNVADTGMDVADTGPPAPPVGDTQGIRALRDAPAGAIDAPITGAFVSAIRPAIGLDPPGFFIQAAPTGPALFVAVPVASLDPVPQKGDFVSLRVTAVQDVDGLRSATTITNLQVLSSGHDLSSLVQPASGLPDLVSAIDQYDAELVDIEGVIATAFVRSGAEFESATFETAAISANPNLVVRLPALTRSALALFGGCRVRLPAAPLIRYAQGAVPPVIQISAWLAGEVNVISCPQTAALRLSELNSNIATANGGDLIELIVTRPGTMRDAYIAEAPTSSAGALVIFPDVQVPIGDLVVVHLGGDGAATELVSSGDCSAPACFGSAWDVVGLRPLVFATRRVITVIDPAGGIVDAVAFIHSAPSSAAPAGYPLEVQRLQAAGQWLPADCAGALCDYTSVPSVDAISVDWNGTDTTPTGNSVRRTGGAPDTNQASDWSVGPASFGTYNP